GNRLVDRAPMGSHPLRRPVVCALSCRLAVRNPVLAAVARLCTAAPCGSNKLSRARWTPARLAIPRIWVHAGAECHRMHRFAHRRLTRISRPPDLAVSDADVYLAPHCDDIAFSIGRFASERGRGRLVTVFSRSGFATRPGLGGLSADEITTLRLE